MHAEICQSLPIARQVTAALRYFPKGNFLDDNGDFTVADISALIRKFNL